jgi:uncharacterized LabA/DUF88 family protein
MNRYVVLVDAGYLLRQSVEILSKKASHRRGDLQITNANGLIKLLTDKASSALNNDNLLRVYWYDGVSGTLTPEQKAIVAMEDVQLRAGSINSKGQQKGVDSKIVIDLIELATNHAISDAMLVTGDGDLAIGVELAQRRGVRVAVLGVEDFTVGVHHAQSFEVTSVADRVIRIGQSELAKCLAYKPTKTTVVTSTSPTAIAPKASVTPTPKPPASKPLTPLDKNQEADIEKAVTSFISSQTPPLTKSAISSTGSVAQDIDKAFIFAIYTSLGGVKLTPEQKVFARSCLRKKLIGSA